jgi:hypothetical protein
MVEFLKISNSQRNEYLFSENGLSWGKADFRRSNKFDKSTSWPDYSTRKAGKLMKVFKDKDEFACCM